MSSTSVEVIADSINSNGHRITTMRLTYWRAIHAEVLRTGTIAHSVASSRALKTSIFEQVKSNPAIPIVWPAFHKGMQGQETLDDNHAYDALNLWLKTRDAAIVAAKAMVEAGLSHQIYNRILEPWMMIRDVVTATDWEPLFNLRHPHHYARITTCDEGHKTETCEDVTHTECPICKSTSVSVRDERVWEDKINLNFPTEYNFQDLAIKMKKALDNSEPNNLQKGDWHLPFIEDIDYDGIQCMLGQDLVSVEEAPSPKDKPIWDMLIKLSAARCAMTSYDRNKGKTVEQELQLADRLLSSSHMSPFEHQARAVDLSTGTDEELLEANPGLAYRETYTDEDGFTASFHSGRFSGGWVQYRKQLEAKA